MNNPLDTNRGVLVALTPYPRGTAPAAATSPPGMTLDPTGLTHTDGEWRQEAADLTLEFKSHLDR